MVPLTDRIDLETVVEKALREDNEKKDATGKLWIGDLSRALEGGPCLVSLYHRYRGEPQKKLTVGQLMMFRQGNRIHDDMVELIRSALPEGTDITGVEVGMGLDDFGVTGRLDLEIKDERFDDPYTVIVDFKTQRGRGMQYMQRATEPKPAHALQVQAYMKEKDAAYGIVFYVDREGQNGFKQFFVERNDEDVLEAAQMIREVVEADEPPAHLTPQVVRNRNKGKDSLKVKWPWQVQYCDLEVCRCRARANKTLPKGIVGYVTNEGELEMKEKYAHMHDWIKERIPE